MFFRGLGLVLCRKRTTRNLTRPKSSANTLFIMHPCGYVGLGAGGRRHYNIYCGNEQPVYWIPPVYCQSHPDVHRQVDDGMLDSPSTTGIAMVSLKGCFHGDQENSLAGRNILSLGRRRRIRKASRNECEAVSHRPPPERLFFSLFA